MIQATSFPSAPRVEGNINEHFLMVPCWGILPELTSCNANGDATSGNGHASLGDYQDKRLKPPKLRFCATYPALSKCKRGDSCNFAHSREEISSMLLTVAEEEQHPDALTDDFFMYRFKTRWCPIGVQHDWQVCVYAHNYQDARRHPDIGYGPRPCVHWKRMDSALEYSQRCPLGVRCPYSHGAKEQLYHPSYFKTVTCQDCPSSNHANQCSRGNICAFYHSKAHMRKKPIDADYSYRVPLLESTMKQFLQPDFLTCTVPGSEEDSSWRPAPPPIPQGKLKHQTTNGSDRGTGKSEHHTNGRSHSKRNARQGSWAAGEATPTTTADSDEAASAADSSRGAVVSVPADRSRQYSMSTHMWLGGIGTPFDATYGGFGGCQSPGYMLDFVPMSVDGYPAPSTPVFSPMRAPPTAPQMQTMRSPVEMSTPTAASTSPWPAVCIGAGGEVPMAGFTDMYGYGMGVLVPCDMQHRLPLPAVEASGMASPGCDTPPRHMEMIGSVMPWAMEEALSKAFVNGQFGQLRTDLEVRTQTNEPMASKLVNNSIPTHNGFVHFRERDAGADSEVTSGGLRRMRSMSS